MPKLTAEIAAMAQAEAAAFEELIKAGYDPLNENFGSDPSPRQMNAYYRWKGFQGGLAGAIERGKLRSGAVVYPNPKRAPDGTIYNEE